MVQVASDAEDTEQFPLEAERWERRAYRKTRHRRNRRHRDDHGGVDFECAELVGEPRQHHLPPSAAASSSRVDYPRDLADGGARAGEVAAGEAAVLTDNEVPRYVVAA